MKAVEAAVEVKPLKAVQMLVEEWEIQVAEIFTQQALSITNINV